MSAFHQALNSSVTLLVQHQGQPYRVIYIFDPRRVTLLLLGGDKAGDDRWYEKNVPVADHILR